LTTKVPVVVVPSFDISVIMLVMSLSVPVKDPVAVQPLDVMTAVWLPVTV